MTTIINANSSGIVETADNSGALQLQTGGTAALTIGTDQNVTLNSTGALTVPVGTTAQRPASPVNGMMRYNSSSTVLGVEAYVNGSWTTVKGAAYSVSYLIVAGGGAGGYNCGSGGGAGGYITGTTLLAPATVYSFVVGAGAAAATSTNGTQGSNSTGFSLTAIGGGGGAQYAGTPTSGGSGGGGAPGSSGAGGAGTTGQGFAGGSGGPANAGGGGGGATAVGATPPNGTSAGGQGGQGIANPITGSTTGQNSSGTYYVAGGGS